MEGEVEGRPSWDTPSFTVTCRNYQNSKFYDLRRKPGRGKVVSSPEEVDRDYIGLQSQMKPHHFVHDLFLHNCTHNMRYQLCFVTVKPERQTPTKAGLGQLPQNIVLPEHCGIYASSTHGIPKSHPDFACNCTLHMNPLVGKYEECMRHFQRKGIPQNNVASCTPTLRNKMLHIARKPDKDAHCQQKRSPSPPGIYCKRDFAFIREVAPLVDIMGEMLRHPGATLMPIYLSAQWPLHSSLTYTDGELAKNSTRKDHHVILLFMAAKGVKTRQAYIFDPSGKMSDASKVVTTTLTTLLQKKKCAVEFLFNNIRNWGPMVLPYIIGHHIEVWCDAWVNYIAFLILWNSITTPEQVSALRMYLLRKLQLPSSRHDPAPHPPGAGATHLARRNRRVLLQQGTRMRDKILKFNMFIKELYTRHHQGGPLRLYLAPQRQPGTLGGALAIDFAKQKTGPTPDSLSTMMKYHS